MKKIYYDLGEEFRNMIMEYGYDINNAIQIGGGVYSTIFNNFDQNGVIISQDYENFDGLLYNEKLSKNVKVYKGGFGINYPKLDIFCMTNMATKIDVPTNKDNYYVFINSKHIDSYLEFAKDRECIFCNFKEIGKVDKKTKMPHMDDNVVNNALLGDIEYDMVDKYVLKNGTVYYLSFYIPSNRILGHDNGRTK